MREKVRDYLAAGTALVWVTDPRIREVIAHTPDGLARTYSQHEVLAHFDILPEFTGPIAEALAVRYVVMPYSLPNSRCVLC